jgi:hypothetical protein
VAPNFYFFLSFRFLYLELPIDWVSHYRCRAPFLILTEFATNGKIDVANNCEDFGAAEPKFKLSLKVHWEEVDDSDKDPEYRDEDRN